MYRFKLNGLSVECENVVELLAATKAHNGEADVGGQPDPATAAMEERVQQILQKAKARTGVKALERSLAAVTHIAQDGPLVTGELARRVNRAPQAMGMVLAPAQEICDERGVEREEFIRRSQASNGQIIWSPTNQVGKLQEWMLEELSQEA